ncbi:hypothetical protein ACFYST_15445 [Kitasatospora sp. NPDC004614]|uniref:hypothetical protein n=1 Tax=unclassified Kitasatospora TaxID=2633591 RepID=UPI0036B82318
MEYDILDWALAVAESTTWRCPDEHSDDLDSGRMAGCDVAQARLAERAERARTEARDAGPAAPPEPPPRSTTCFSHPTPEGTARWPTPPSPPRPRRISSIALQLRPPLDEVLDRGGAGQQLRFIHVVARRAGDATSVSSLTVMEINH